MALLIHWEIKGCSSDFSCAILLSKALLENFVVEHVFAKILHLWMIFVSVMLSIIHITQICDIIRATTQ